MQHSRPPQLKWLGCSKAVQRECGRGALALPWVAPTVGAAAYDM